MNTTEQKLITDLGEQLKSLPSTKDNDADQCISQNISNQPDAIYKLVQVVLIQNMAIDQLKEQLKTAQEKQNTQNAPKGFLDDLKEKLFGQNSSGQNQTNTQRMNSNSIPTQNSQAYTQPAAQAGSGSSFLHQAMTVGAGVAGGMLLGNALESLFTHNNSAYAASPENINQINDVNNINDNLPDVSNDDLSLDGNDNMDSQENDFDNNDNSFDDSSSDGDW